MKQWQLLGVVGVTGAIVGAMAGLLARQDTHGLIVWLVAVGIYALVLWAMVRVLVWLQKRGTAWIQ